MVVCDLGEVIVCASVFRNHFYCVQVVGWYHSHPGFGCWFSGTDINTQQSFEQLNSRAVGIVVDPVQSVRGKVGKFFGSCYLFCRSAWWINNDLQEDEISVTVLLSCCGS